MHKTGLVIPEFVPWGTHLCQFYETKNDLLQVLIPCYRLGLEANQRCIWITLDVISVEEATRALRAGVTDFDVYLARGQMEIIPSDQWYVFNGRFDLDLVLQAWCDKTKSACDGGYAGLRASGSVACLHDDYWADLASR